MRLGVKSLLAFKCLVGSWWDKSRSS